jgi:hypothetical protein
MSEIFVRESFYIAPPEKDAGEREWKQWIKADTNAARGAKAAFTRAANAKAKEEGEVNMPPPCTSLRKIGGAWRQVAASGFVGDFESGSSHMEPTVEETQTADAIKGRWVKHKRGKETASQRRARRKRNQ